MVDGGEHERGMWTHAGDAEILNGGYFVACMLAMYLAFFLQAQYLLFSVKHTSQV